MKILNINSYYYSSSVHRQFQLAIREKGIESITFAPLAVGYKPREECRYEEEKYVKKFECFNNRDRYIFHLKHKKIQNTAFKEFNFEEFDCIHAHSLFSNGYIALKIYEEYGIPYIVTVRDTDVNTFFRKMPHLRNLGNRILLNASAVVFLSQAYRDHVINKYVKQKKIIVGKSHIIPNGIDEFWLNNKGIPKSIQNKNTINILQVGTLSRRKNVPVSVRALELLIKKGYNVKFTLVGKIVDERIKKLINEKSFINYISPKPAHELLDIYRENDIFVMPSITETFGLVYAEAISQGLPVIYTRGQGFDKQFEEGIVGYSVDSSDVNEMTERLIDIITNYDDISRNCIELSSTFNWTKISERYKEIYLRCKKINEIINLYESWKRDYFDK